MNREILLKVAYYSMLNPMLLDAHPFGEYNHLLNSLIYKGESYLNTKMISYKLIKNSMNHPCVTFTTEINHTSLIFKDCKEMILFKEPNIIEDEWIKVSFDSDKYLKEYLMNDVVKQITNMENQIKNTLIIIEKAENTLKEEKVKTEEFIKILNYLKS